MNLIRRYHRLFRALLLGGLIWGLLALWHGMVSPEMFTNPSFWDFGMIFLLLAVAAIATHRLGRFLAPPLPGQIDEDSDDVEAAPSREP